MIRIAPGDVAEQVAGPYASPEQIQQVREELGLHRPFLAQYASYVQGLVRGDLGTSLATREEVTDMLRARIPVTLSLAGVALVMGIIAGLLLGLASSWRPHGIVDRVVSVVCAVGVSTPQFLIGLILAIFLAVNRPWLPATGFVPLSDGAGEWLKHLLLPAIALMCLPAAEIARQLRGAMIETMEQDYILAARAKGTAPHLVRLKHALKNAAIPPVTVLGFRVAQMLGGAVVIERVFALPGIGHLTVESVLARDYIALLGIVLILAVAVSVINLLVDVSYLYFNPKMRTA